MLFQRLFNLQEPYCLNFVLLSIKKNVAQNNLVIAAILPRPDHPRSECRHDHRVARRRS